MRSSFLSLENPSISTSVNTFRMSYTSLVTSHHPPSLPPSHQPPTLTTLPHELLLTLLPFLPFPSLPTLHATCSLFRSLKPHYLTLLRHSHLLGHKLCILCIRLQPHTDFPWHAPSHTHELCLRHLDFWVCEQRECDLRHFAFKLNRRELELRLLRRWRTLRGHRSNPPLDVVSGSSRGASGGRGTREATSQLLETGQIQGPRLSGDGQVQAESAWVAESNRTCRWSIPAMIDEHLTELCTNTDFSHFGIDDDS